MIKQIFKNNSYQLVECQRDNRTLEILIKQKLYASMSYAYCVRMTAQIHLGCSWDFPWGRSLEEGRTTCWVRRGCPEDFNDSLFALSEQFKPSNRREWILKNYSTIHSLLVQLPFLASLAKIVTRRGEYLYILMVIHIYIYIFTKTAAGPAWSFNAKNCFTTLILEIRIILLLSLKLYCFVFQSWEFLDWVSG